MFPIHSRIFNMPSSFKFYSNLRLNIKLELGSRITNFIDPFWYHCLPLLLLQRLNEYGTGIVTSVLAYERYVLICKPSEKSLLLSTKRRFICYISVTATVLVFFISDASVRFIYGGAPRLCADAPVFGFNNNPELRLVLNVLSIAIFCLVPGGIQVILYWRALQQLLTSKAKKLGRNMNLSLAFVFGSLTTIIFSFSKIFCDIYNYDMANKSKYELYRHPIMANSFNSTMVNSLLCVTSVVSPFLLLVVHKSYREPFQNVQRKLTECLIPRRLKDCLKN